MYGRLGKVLFAEVEMAAQFKGQLAECVGETGFQYGARTGAVEAGRGE